MPTNHLSLQDTETLVPDGIDNDYTLASFDLPGLNTDTRPFVSYRITPSGVIHLQMDLNGTLVVDEEFDGNETRTLNEIVDLGTAKARRNQLTVRRLTGPAGFRISDIIFFWPAD
jgi:hypothetical protein